MSASSVLGMVEALAHEQPNLPALIDDHNALSFGEFGALVARIAGLLSARGLSGERVLLLGPASVRWVGACFGALRAGAVVVPLSPLHPEPEQRYVASASAARAVLTVPAWRDRAAAVAPGAMLLDIHADVDASSPGQSAPALPSDADDALILYTSGTTGKPKGARLSHSMMASLAQLLGQAWQLGASDRLLHVLPLHHLHGLGIALFSSLLNGTSVRLLEQFDPVRVWEELGAATVFMAVPTMHKKLFEAFDGAGAAERARWEHHARRLRLVTSGSAALPVSVGERWRELTGKYPLERFGMTEIGVGIANPLAGERVPGSCGLPLPGMDVRIVDESGRDVAPGETGEIWIRGPTVMQAYDGDPEASEAAFQDGWFRSGDTATWLPNGYVKILGRTSIDIIKSGGYKLSALEIEEVVREHPATLDAAVVGVPDDTWGERVVLVVTAQRGMTLDPDELRAWLKTRLAPYKVPRQVLVCDELPRNVLGKVVKTELKRRLCANSS